MIICIDGPAASGKSTVASKLARKLGFIHLNSGALFRAVALENIQSGENPALIARKLKFEFKLQASKQTVLFVNDKDTTGKLDSPEIAEVASKIAVIPELREELLKIQRLQTGNIVVEGRDAGSVVFPDAKFKFYLEASIEERARRRHLDLEGRFSSSLNELKQDLIKRDARDESREHAPQKPAVDAVIINTDSMDVDKVVDFIFNKIV